jgi:hypothetical protein
MNATTGITILQCDGSVKVYDVRPWWVNEKQQGMSYSEGRKDGKHEKIVNTMMEIAAINHEAYIDSRLALGIVTRKNERGTVTIREVGEKLAR